jgi:aprataxin
MHICKSHHADSSGPCGYESDRQWNLDRHLHAYEQKERQGYQEYEKELSEPIQSTIYTKQHAKAVFNRYPKSSLHALLLPISPRSRLPLFEAFQDPAFLAAVRKEALELKAIIASEVGRRYAKYSAQDGDRQAVLNGEVEILREEDMPKGRDYEKDMLVGVHARPWMDCIHVHVLTRDLFSKGIEHKRHYNSFATPFFIDLAEFPLSENEIRQREKSLNTDLVCWRCGRNFDDDFTSLKKHLAEEWEKWKAE